MRRILTLGLSLSVLACWAGQAAAQERDPVPALALLLKDKDPIVRRSSAFSLKFLPQAEAAIPSLVEAFKDQDEIVRDNAVDAIVLMTPRATVPTLVLALRDKDPLSRLHAARSLGRLRRYTDESIPDLILLLKDTNADVRAEAVEALKRIQNSRREY
jgi:HEAT repeat protein